MLERIELTKDDIKAFRKADYMVLRWKPTGDYPESLLQIELVKRATQPLEHDLVYRLEAKASRRGHTLWTDREKRWEIDEVCASVDFYPEQHTPKSTIVNLLKAGDTLNFEFWINNSELLDNAALVGQYCILSVYRPTKSGADKIMRFDLFNQVGPFHYPGMYRVTERNVYIA